MPVTVKGLDQIIAKSKQLVMEKLPRATAVAINSVARQAMRKSTRSVAKDVKVPTKLVRGRARLKQKATTRKLIAQISVNRGNLPMYRLISDANKSVRASKGQIRIGQHRVQRGFVQTLKNGRKQVMSRQGRERYPIDVVKIPLAAPLTNAFHRELKGYESQIKVEITKTLGSALRR
jgi:prophage minor tail protein Z (GPZ)|nr:MAG TPA: minor tail protein [Bacteriophage sp.]